MQELINIFSNISIPEYFGGNLDDENYDTVYSWGYDIINKYFASSHCLNGVSKMVFILNDSNWVIKIPFNGYFYITWNEEDDWICEKEEWDCFRYAMNDWDYCNVELEKYKDARKQGLECFFAETKYLCKGMNNHPIYIQEKVIPVNKDTIKRKASNRALKIAGKTSTCLSKTWLALAIDFYGNEKVQKFVNYIENIDPEISQDLHYGNYGYRLDGSPCLLDFSGWNEDI